MRVHVIPKVVEEKSEVPKPPLSPANERHRALQQLELNIRRQYRIVHDSGQGPYRNPKNRAKETKADRKRRIRAKHAKPAVATQE